MYNILEHKQAIAENIQKAFSDTPEDIEKAKWQIGEIRVDSRGIAHECYEYTADGKPRLRRVKKNKSASTTSTDDGKLKKNNVTIQAKIDEARKNGFSLYSDGKKEITITKRENLHDKSKNYYDVKFRVRNEKGDNFTQDETVRVKTKELTESYIEKLAKEKFSDKELNNRKNTKNKQEDNKKEDDAQSKKKVVPIQETDKAVKLKCLFELEYSPKGGFTSSLVKDKSITIDSWFPKSALEENGSPKDWIIRKREKELSEKYLPLNSQVLSAKLHILI